MTRLHLFLLTVLICLVGTSAQGQVSPLRPSEESVTGRDHSIMAPLLDEWVRQAALPTARNLSGVDWATATHAFASGNGLTLVETLDGGVTWNEVDLPGTSTDPLYNVSSVDATICVAIGNSSTFGPDVPPACIIQWTPARPGPAASCRLTF